MRRIGPRRGERPQALGQRTYQWLYLYGFVRPGSGQVECLLLPEVDTEIVSPGLEALRQSGRRRAKKHILLVLDRAGWHVSKGLEVPEGSTWPSLPPTRQSFSPLNTSALVHEAMANQRIETLDDLEDLLVDRCRSRSPTHPIQSHTLFNWWPIDHGV